MKARNTIAHAFAAAALSFALLPTPAGAQTTAQPTPRIGIGTGIEVRPGVEIRVAPAPAAALQAATPRLDCRGPDPADCAKTEAERQLLLTTFYGLTTEEQSLRLIAQLRDVNAMNAAGTDSALSVAIALGRKRAVAALLRRGADPLATDRSGSLLINNIINRKLSSSAVIEPDVLECLRLALEHAARAKRLPAKPPLDATLVFRANNQIAVPVLELLLKYGADPLARGTIGSGAPIDMAIGAERPDVLRLMLAPNKHRDRAALDARAYDLLARGKAQMLAVLRAGGADPARYARNNPEALYDALRPERGADILAFVLKAGADPNRAKAGERRLPIIMALNNEDKLRLLLKYGADPNTRDLPVGYTVLAQVLYAPSEIYDGPGKTRHVDKIGRVRLLLDAGANPNGDHGGWGRYGALGHAKREDKDVIALLVARGATLAETEQTRRARLQNLPASPSVGPLTLALGMEREDLALALIQRDKKLDPHDGAALPMAAQRGARELVQALLAAGADPNAADERGVTAIAAAERRHDQAMIGMLAAAGAKSGGRPQQPRPELAGGSAFAQEAAHAIDAAALFDPPRYGINSVREGVPLAFYGQGLNQIQELRCERSAHFGIVAFANEAAGIAVGVCEREARRVRDLAADSARSIDALLGQLAQGGNADRARLAQMGWSYQKSTAPDGAEVHYFPVILVGHGFGVATTAVLIPRGAKAAVVVQANTERLCKMQGMATQTPLCSDTRKALTDIALSLGARFAGDARQ